MRRLKEFVRLDFLLTNNFKSNCTFLMSLIAIALFIINPTREKNICMYAMLVSTIADLMLMNYKNIPEYLFKSKKLYVGMALFVVTHILYICCFGNHVIKATMAFVNAEIAFFAFILVSMMSIFCWCICTFGSKPLFKIMSLLYMIVILADVLVIYVCSYIHNYEYIYAAIGITFFLISDILILFRETVKDTSTIRKLIWIFYPIGQMLIIFNA
ncbi:MAG: hypothetical protein J6C46_11105 [Clostridia bacterium]|nr:hypothetical protein [Clostridia bacterium]